MSRVVSASTGKIRFGQGMSHLGCGQIECLLSATSQSNGKAASQAIGPFLG